MMVDGAEERQLKGPIDVLAPYTSPRRRVVQREPRGGGPSRARDGHPKEPPSASCELSSKNCGFRAIPYTRSDRIRTPIPTFSYTR
jgi:hypothetical protein